MSRKILCSRCGKIVDVNHDCENKYKDVRKRTQLSNSKWIHVRDNVRRRDLVCYLCWNEGVYCKGEEVHHIRPRDIDSSDENVYNEDNCIYLCQYHHHKVHADGWQKYYDIFKKHIEEVKNGCR